MSRDSVQLYAAAREIPVREALDELSQRTALPRRMLSKWARDYQTLLLDPLDRVMAVLQEGRRRILRRKSGHVSGAARALQAWPGSDIETLSRTLGQVFSDVSRPDLVAAMRPWRLKTGRRKFRDMIVIPGCDVVGRPRSLQIYDAGGNEYEVVFPLFNEVDNKIDVGLCLLDQVSPEGPIFCVPGGKLASHLYCRHYADSLEPFSVVGWNSGTLASSWYSLRHREKYFWSSTCTIDTFHQARLAGYAAVALDPQITADDPLIRLRRMGVAAWRRTVLKTAQAWEIALGQWLLARSDHEAQSAVIDLALDNDEARLVVEAVTGADKTRLNHILEMAERENSVVLEGAAVVQANDAWVEATPGGPQQISDVVIHLDRIQHPVAGGPDYLVGYVGVEGDIEPFRETLEAVRNNTLGWLTRFLISRNRKLPQVASRWSSRLFAVAQAFHNPEIVPCLDRVGYVPDYGIVFPRFIVRDGEMLTEGPLPDLAGAVPGQNLEAPKLTTAIPALGMATDTSAAVWAVLLTLLGNADAQMRGAESKGVIVLTSGEEDVACQAVDLLSSALGLPWVTPSDAKQLTSLDSGHLLPPVIDLRTPCCEDLLAYLATPEPKSLLFLATDLTPWQELGLGGWTVIDNCFSGNLKPFPHEHIPALLVGGLIRLQRNLSDRDTTVETPELFEEVFKGYPWTSETFLKAEAVLRDRLPAIFAGDIRRAGNTATDTDRSLAPLFYVDRMSPGRVKEEGQTVSIPAGAMLKTFAELTKHKPALSTIRYLLREAGLLQGMPGTSIDMSAADWSAARGRYLSLLPDS